MTKSDDKKDFEIDGKSVKQIIVKGKDGEIKHIMHRLKKGFSGKTPHIVFNNPEQSHMDVFKDGQKLDEDRSIKPNIAGVGLNIKTKEYTYLPPLIVEKDEDIPTDDLEKVRSYLKRVKLKEDSGKP